MDDDSDDVLFLAQIKELGEKEVRRRLEMNGFPLTHYEIARQWIAEIDQEPERRKDSINSRAAIAAERQARAAEIANKRAMIALIIAAASMIISIVAIIVARS